MAAQPAWTAHAYRLNPVDDLMRTCRGTQFTFQRRLRTSNGMERLNEAIWWRERVIRIAPNWESAIRLLGALLLERGLITEPELEAAMALLDDPTFAVSSMMMFSAWGRRPAS